MKIVVTTQSELDAIKLDFNGEIVITGGTVDNPIKLKEYYADVILSGNAVVSMYGKSQVKEMWGSSQVKEMWGSSQVKEMRGSSQVKEMRESSQVNVMLGSSQVNVMRESSQVKEMRGSSQVKEMWGSSIVSKILGQKNKISCFGFNYLFIERGVDVSGIKLNDTSQIILFDSFRTSPTIQFYLKNYPVKESDGILTIFKSVHKTKDGRYLSNHDRNFEYKIGEKKTHAVSKNIDDSCDVGIHGSHLQWAVNFGKSWDDMAILELEVPMDSVVVAKDCDGKIRTGVAEVIREVPIEEYQQYL